jgi:hypothetical protein
MTLLAFEKTVERMCEVANRPQLLTCGWFSLSEVCLHLAAQYWVHNIPRSVDSDVLRYQLRELRINGEFKFED